MSLDIRVLNMIKRYMGALWPKKVLKTMEEVEANTNETNLVAAPVVAELSNKLAQVVKYITPDYANAISPLSSDKVSGTFSYTAPGNGILYVHISQTVRTPIWVYINNEKISSVAYTGSQSGNPTYFPLTFILAKGDKFEISCSSTNQVLYFTKFVPFVRG